ncbi:MAG: hypothetical protein U9R29_09295 [Thermodesulfobacteriota bacterium]|nr:hypothetical protein [Thermodesulfobacteriota bacterium]
MSFIAVRGLKYLLLFFFVKILLIDMPAYAIASFVQSPYWFLSDVKMLRFFTHISITTMVVFGTIADPHQNQYLQCRMQWLPELC